MKRHHSQKKNLIFLVISSAFLISLQTYDSTHQNKLYFSYHVHCFFFLISSSYINRDRNKGIRLFSELKSGLFTGQRRVPSLHGVSLGTVASDFGIYLINSKCIKSDFKIYFLMVLLEFRNFGRRADV